MAGGSDVLRCPEQETLLRTEGIMAKGYGLIPKLVMIEPELSLTAKAIYAYLCSLAGSGDTAFPTRNTMIRTLGINKDTFYKHFGQLVGGGWVFVHQQKSESCQFAHNVYTLASQSPKLAPSKPLAEGESHSTLHSKVVSEGIRRAGYGMIPRVVMQSTQLSHKAKAVYAYFCSFAGAGESAFPNRDVILYHLAVSQSTYYKALHELVDSYYIAVRQRQERGRFAICDYYLLDTQPPCTKFSDTEKTHTVQPDTVKQDTEKPYAEQPDTENQSTTNTSPAINSPKKNSSSSNNPSIIGYDDWQFTLDDEPQEISAMLNKMDRKTIKNYIAKDIGLDIIELLDPEETRKKVVYLIDLVAEALFYPSLKVVGTDYPPWQFQKRLLSLSLEEYQFVLKRVGQVKGVRNLKAYYLACLFNAHDDLEAAIDQEVKADLNL